MATFGSIPSNIEFSRFQIIADAASRPSSPATGDTVYQLDNNRIYAYNGSSWVLVAGNLPMARVRRTTNQSVANASLTAVQWEVVDFDTDSMVDLGTNNTRVTIQTAGKYSVTAYVQLDTSAGEQARINVNGGHRYKFAPLANEVGSDMFAGTVSVRHFDSGDYIELTVRHGAGSSRNIDASTAPEVPTLSVHWIGA